MNLRHSQRPARHTTVILLPNNPYMNITALDISHYYLKGNQIPSGNVFSLLLYVYIYSIFLEYS